MSIQLGSAYGKITIDSSGVTVGVGNATKSLGTLSEVANKLGTSMQKIGGAMTLGLTVPITAFFASSVKSAMDAESALAEVEAVLKSTSGAAGVTIDQVKKLATEFQKVTKFSDEQVLSGASMLLTFTKIGSDVFPMATEAMLNMAEKFGSVENASIQLGKALNDPVAGVSALRRVGVMLSAEQEQQIKDFMAVNDIASAQKVILKELEVEFGGLARAAGDTAAGKLAQFKNRLDDFKEVIGNAIIPSLIRFMDALTPLLEALASAPPWVIDAIVAFLTFAAALGPLTTVLGTVLKILGAFLPGGALAGVGTFISGTLLPAFSSLFTFITATAIPAIAAFVVANAWWIAPLLLVAATVYLVYLAFKNNFMGITTTVKQLWEIIKFYFGQIVKRISDSFTKIPWGQIGKYMLMGLANGMLAGIPSIVMAAAKAGAAALAAMKNALDSHSPSRKFFKLGLDSGQGYSNGMTTSMANLNKNSPYQKLIDTMNKNTKLAVDFSKKSIEEYYGNLGKMNQKYASGQMNVMSKYLQNIVKYYQYVAKYSAMMASSASGSNAVAIGSMAGINIGSGSVANNDGNGGIYMEPLKPIKVEATNPVTVEQAKPVTVEIINNFSSGVTTRQAQDMVRASSETLLNTLSRAIAGGL